MADYKKIKKALATGKEPSSVQRAMQREATAGGYASVSEFLDAKIKAQADYAAKKGVATFAEAKEVRAKERKQEQKVRAERVESKKEARKDRPHTVIDISKPSPDPVIRETIKLTPKKEEKGVLGKAWEAQKKIITSPVTTAVLGTVLAGLVGGAAIGGAAVVRGGGTAVITRTATLTNMAKLGQKMASGASITTQRAFQGVTKSPTIAKIFRNTGRVAYNSKNTALKTSYLRKLASTAKNPWAVLGVLGTTLYTSLFWAPNEKGDALMTLSIAQREAAQGGDIEMVNEIAELIDDVNDISASIPVIGFLRAELAKFKAAAVASKVYKRDAERIVSEAKKREEEPTFAEQREQSDIESRERKEEWRKEDEKYYEKQREESEEYYEEIQESKTRRELRERSEDEKYWEGIRKEGEERKTAERAEDEEYWDEIYRKKEERKSGEKTTPYTYWKKKKKEKTNEPWNEEDKKIVDDWNAGKSALNFKWLGL